MIVRSGKHLLRHMSCLQTLVALSSGEAEHFALIRGACTSLGIQSHYQHWMIEVPIQIYSASSAARGEGSEATLQEYLQRGFEGGLRGGEGGFEGASEGASKGGGGGGEE